MAVLDDIVITGSSDGTARVWDLGRGTQQQLLLMPSQQSVTAVALPSVSLAVTATAKGGAMLWRAGAPIRRFEPLPVSVLGALPHVTVHTGCAKASFTLAEH
jgi:WD40 repeat protein